MHPLLFKNIVHVLYFLNFVFVFVSVFVLVFVFVVVFVVSGRTGTVLFLLTCNWQIGMELAWDCVIGQGLTFDRYFGDVLSSAWIVHRHWVGFGSWDGLEFV